MKKEARTNHAEINTIFASSKANAVRQRLAIVTAKEVIDRILSSCSIANWYRLRRRVAWLIRFIHFLHDRTTVRTGHLVLEDYDAAATAIVRIIQRSSYSQEIKDLKTRGEVKSSTNIVSLNPVVDDHGILRVKGRIAHAPVADAARNQIILPRDHPVTTMMVPTPMSQLVTCYVSIVYPRSVRSCGFPKSECSPILSLEDVSPSKVKC